MQQIVIVPTGVMVEANFVKLLPKEMVKSDARLTVRAEVHPWSMVISCHDNVSVP